VTFGAVGRRDEEQGFGGGGERERRLIVEYIIWLLDILQAKLVWIIVVGIFVDIFIWCCHLDQNAGLAVASTDATRTISGKELFMEQSASLKYEVSARYLLHNESWQ
jgi:hypothetical protein